MTSPAHTGLPGPAVIDGVDVDAVAAAARACPAVSALDGGSAGEFASYLPGRKVPGVVVADGRVRVRVRSRWGVPACDLAALVRAAVVPLTGYRPVDVVIADIDDPPPGPSSWVAVGRRRIPPAGGARRPIRPDPGLPPV